MAWRPNGRLNPTLSYPHLARFTSPARLALAALLAFGVLFGSVALTAPSGAEAGAYEHLMCGLRVPKRTQTVSIDPDMTAAGITTGDVLAAFQPWNDLFIKYHGFPIFAAYDGNVQDADILVTAHAGPRTWVNTPCNPGFVRRGANQAVVAIGDQDAWRNRNMLPHELGHALGFADHGEADASSPGHVGYKPCAGYVGVMSYCTGPQSWFLDRELPNLYLDGQLVRDYWSD